MAHRIMKGILFFGGLAVATAGMVLFFLKLMTLEAFVMKDVFGITGIGAVGTLVASFGLLMHAKDVRGTKKGLSVFCNVLAIFWLVTGGLNLTGAIVLLAVFG